VLAVGGSPPEDFEQIARRYVAASRLARRTITGRLRAMMRVARALLTPAPTLDRISRRLELPAIAHATLAADSESWRQSHGLAAGGA
jgi:hypothetical protein